MTKDAMQLEFCKYEGAGNDFVVVDGRSAAVQPTAEMARALCNRHTGVGGDGLMILTREEGYDFGMRYFNADGSEAEMCGNGGRCIALFAHHLGIGGERKFFIGRDGEHTAGIISLSEDTALIELGIVDVDGFGYSDGAFTLNTGVPHYVEFVDDLAAVDVMSRGRVIRNAECYRPGGTNVNFVEVAGPGYIRVRTYERGVEGETQACGTGVVASAIATYINIQNDRKEFTVGVPGGELEVSFETSDGSRFTDVRLTGPARRVFCGTVRVGNIR